MIFLILGVLIWSGLHLIPALGVQMRAAWESSEGTWTEKPS